MAKVEKFKGTNMNGFTTAFFKDIFVPRKYELLN